MVPELGHLALIIAFCFAGIQAVVPMIGSFRGNALWMAYGQPAALGQFLFVLFSFVCLGWAFVHDDFSVVYVATNSNSQLPVIYKFCAVWGAHEGSLLLWALMLAGWTLAVALFSRNLPDEMLARVLSVMGLVSIGFLAFMLITSNPFLRHLPDFPADGRDLNPLLQDPGLVIHPPMLYMGYVGFSVAFAFAIAALIGGRLDAAWARWSRPWTNTAWAFLTVGIALGSWWAYYELGWGGWWFWDPVENASFMPWLAGTALVHSLAVTEKRGAFKSWTLLLAIFCFSLSLLGTFLVRSGVLTSVHAFASDPQRGVFILFLLAIVVGGSLLLYAFRAPGVRGQSGFGLVSRESFLLINNIVLVVATVSVLLGTLYPLLIEALDGGKISVGPPYFNAVFAPLMALLALFLGVGPMLRWKRTPVDFLVRTLRAPAGLAVIGGAAFPFLYAGSFSVVAAMAVALALWILLTTLQLVRRQVESRRDGWRAVFRLGRSFNGMVVAHLGFAVTLTGATLVSVYKNEQDLRMAPGDEVEVAGMVFRFEGTERVRGPNYLSDQGSFRVFRDGREILFLAPEKRFYPVQESTMTEAAIDAGITRDVFVALGEPLGDDAWAVRIHIKPFVRWIWSGAMLMALGGLLAMSDRRYRLRRRADAVGQVDPGLVASEGGVR